MDHLPHRESSIEQLSVSIGTQLKSHGLNSGRDSIERGKWELEQFSEQRNPSVYVTAGDNDPIRRQLAVDKEFSSSQTLWGAKLESPDVQTERREQR
ncbi:MAG: hypothetical protein VYE53_11350 [Planctomycetota bacterium]|nr:hypothetical protein [Planctomycetota bacterium]